MLSFGPTLEPFELASTEAVPALTFDGVDITGTRLSFDAYAGELVHVAGGAPVAQLRVLAIASGHAFGGPGRCLIDGVDTMALELAEREELRRRRVARALLIDQLQPHLPLMANVVQSALSHGVPARVAFQRAALEIDALGLAEHRSLPPSVLGPAERRLAIIARALVCRPRLLIVERPELGLADAGVAAVRSALQNATASGACCVLMTTEHPRRAAAADRRVEIGRVPAPA